MQQQTHRDPGTQATLVGCAPSYHCTIPAPPYIQFVVMKINFEQYSQGCALRKITRSPKVPNYEIQGVQHKAYMEEIRLSGRPKTKVSRLRHPGTLRAQPWGLIRGTLHPTKCPQYKQTGVR